MEIKDIQIIIRNLCLQLIAVQQQILSRQENNSIPSVQELTAQSRLISSIDKMRKMLDKLQKEAAEEANDPAAMPAQKSDPPPYGVATFNRYTYLLKEHNTATADAKVPIEGKDVNLRWFIYNLYQYYKPVKQRLFIADPVQFTYLVDMTQVSKEIGEFLNARMAA